MRNLLVVIPTSVGIKINPEVIDSIKNQSIPTEIKIVRNPKIYVKSSDKIPIIDEHIKRNTIIANSRNMALPFLMKRKYAVMHDTTVQHINPNNLKTAIELLESDKKIMAVAMPSNIRHWWILEQLHIKNGCIVARKEVWQTVNFSIIPPHRCTCMSFINKVRKMGIYRFLDLSNDRIKILTKNKV